MRWLLRWLLGSAGVPTRKSTDSSALTGNRDFPALASGQRLLLHVGCGQARLTDLPAGFQRGWQEWRIDLDPDAHPDLIASFSDLSLLPDACADALFASHVIEHLYWFEVPQALAEARRVLKPDGMLVLTCPDLQSAAAMIAEDRLFETAYLSPAGPITPFDIVYSYRPFVQRSPQTMSHKCGFTLTTLTQAVREAGFTSVYGLRRPEAFDLWLLAVAQALPEAELTAQARQYLPPH